MLSLRSSHNLLIDEGRHKKALGSASEGRYPGLSIRYSALYKNYEWPGSWGMGNVEFHISHFTLY